MDSVVRREGGQIGNKNAEKWTEEAALEIGRNLISWMKEKDEEGNDKGNIFYKDFLVYENDYDDSLIVYLSNKFQSFSDIMKKAKEIQELKLIKFGIADRLQPTMTIFCLKNHHNYSDRQDLTINNKSDLSRFTDEQLEEELNRTATQSEAAND